MRNSEEMRERVVILEAKYLGEMSVRRSLRFGVMMSDVTVESTAEEIGGGSFNFRT